MFEVLIMLLLHFAASVSLLLAVAVLVTLVVTAYLRGMVVKLADEPEPRPQGGSSPRCAIRWANPDAPGRSRPRAPGQSNVIAGTAA
jgi:hypothetical protein